MQLSWSITNLDVARTRAFLDRHQDNAFVQHRIQKNVNGPRPQFSRDMFWHRMLACPMTTRQNSGPTSAVSRLIHTDPFPMSYCACASCSTLEAMVRDCLTNYGGIRRQNGIAREATFNLAQLEAGLWPEIERIWNDLARSDDAALERQAARLIARKFYGFGPKQSRNLFQSLGLTRYEIPLDSRVAKRLVEFGCPLPISKHDLPAQAKYEAALDWVQELCRRCAIYPCVLDAAMFASYDGDGWTGINTIW